MSKIRVGILGAAGYTAGELIRILLQHPDVELAYLQSESNAGKPVDSIHKDLFHVHELEFCSNIKDHPDVVFLCKGHGESAPILRSGIIDKNTRIIDLSQDLRLHNTYPEIRKIYGQFIYGLPELNKKEIKTGRNIANPGCFATCIQLGLLPLAANNLLLNDVHISAVTGSTGAGQKLTDTSQFNWRHGNMSVYKPFNHQHLKEINQSLKQLDPDFNHQLLFIPYRGNFTRGIIATMYVPVKESQSKVDAIYASYYREDPFVSISTSNIDLKQVVNTNYCRIYIEKFDKYLMVISTVDNLVKGASGQAVQNMNLMFGLDESKGLLLKGTAF